jgi:3-phosphoglycerate kinase
MGVVKVCQDKHFEHIAIAYEGGEMTLRFREYSQTLKLFKNLDAYGEHNVVVSSSAWVEMEQTIKRYEHRYYVMLSNGKFMNIEEPTRDNEFNDECCIVKISNEDYVD